MKRLLQLGLLLLVAGLSAHAATWTVVQHVTADNPSGCQGNASCSVTISATGAGHALIGFAQVYKIGGYVTFSSASGGGTWNRCTACEGHDNYSGTNYVSTFIGYVTNSSSGATSVTLTASATGVYWSIDIIELAWSGSTLGYDTGGATDLTSACTSCTGQALSLTGGSDVIVQGINPAESCSAISGGAGYTAFQDFLSWGTGYASATNTTDGSSPTWTCTSGRAVVSAIALVGHTAYTATPSVTNTASDTLSRLATMARSETETHAASDALARTAQFGRGQTETNTSSDSLSRLRASFGTMAETHAATDALGRVGGFARADSESNAASDTLGRAGNFVRAELETNPSTDGLARLGTFGRGATESHLAGDLLSALRPGNLYTAALNEVLNLSDALGRLGNFARGKTETNTGSDALGRAAGFSRTPAEQNTASDTLARWAALYRQNQEAEVISDFLARTLAANRHSAELLKTTDVLGERWAGRLIILPRHQLATPGQQTSEAAPGRTTAGSATNTLKSGSAPASAKTGTATNSPKAGSAPAH